MWSSRISILKTVLEIRLIIGNLRTKEAIYAKSLQDGALGQSYGRLRPRAKTFPKTFPSPKDRKAFGGLCEERREWLGIRLGLGGEILAPRPH